MLMLRKFTELIDVLPSTLMETTFRQKKAFQLFLVSEFALLIGIILELSKGDSKLPIVLSLVFLGIAISFLSLYKKHTQIATGILLISHTLLATTLMWLYGGLRDETVLAFPMILIFATVLGSFRFVSIIFAIIFIVVLANGFANDFGWYTNNVSAITVESAILVNMILLIIFMCTYVAALSINRLINSLLAENEKVKKSKIEIQKLVHQDTLTGLPNRTVARQQFIYSYAKALKQHSSIALLFLDLDDFKSINDSLGHQVGDQFLKVIAKRIRLQVNSNGFVYRLGGDEFLIILNQFQNRFDIEQISHGICETVNKPLLIDQFELSASCSIGISIAPKNAKNFDEAMKYADIAVYKAKEAGRNQFCIANRDMIDRSRDDFELIEDLRSSVAHKQLQVHYQAKMDLTNNKIVGAEALIRWQHHRLGPLSPDKFIPLAERSGLIGELGELVLVDAMIQCKAWHQEGFKDLIVSVNVSPIQFNRPGFAQKVIHLLAKHQLGAKFLELEITENVLIEQNETLQLNITRLVDSGVKLAIDDFGKGYSNLAYIKKLNVHAIKIDREFIHNIMTNQDDLAIVTAIIDMAKRLNLQTVAEGIETVQIAEQLIELNCDLGQGFLWSAAVNADTFRLQLKKQHECV